MPLRAGRQCLCEHFGLVREAASHSDILGKLQQRNARLWICRIVERQMNSNQLGAHLLELPVGSTYGARAINDLIRLRKKDTRERSEESSN